MSFEGTPHAQPGAECWLAAVLGNTHVRWGWFQDQTLIKVELFSAQQPLPWPDQTELWLAAVGAAPVPTGSAWVHQLQLQDVPLGNHYPTLGLDRALALWAAGIHHGWPCLVIDAGTALTFTGADPEGSLVGGAILPGLGLQAQALSDHTAQLPKIDWDPGSPLPPRWAKDTPTAIRSGILYTVLAGVRSFIADWRQDFPESAVLLTGGDGIWLDRALEDPRVVWDPDLVLKGIAGCRQTAYARMPHPRQVTPRPLEG
ncbi:MAG: pantothenate kinase [Thermostichus sp. HHBFW_bins_43]